MSGATIKKMLETIQLEMSQYAVAEAKAKKEKAEVELETARIQQAHIREIIEAEKSGMFKVEQGGLKS